MALGKQAPPMDDEPKDFDSSLPTSTSTQDASIAVGNAYTFDPTGEYDEKAMYPGGIALGFISIALALAVFLTALDNLIITTAIPYITTEFESLEDVGWYGSAYLITTGGFQLIWARFYILFPIKWVFITSIVIFEVGSLVCGAAPNSIALILGRAVAGLGSAGLYSGAMVIIGNAVRLEKRPLFMGVFGGVYAVASVIGPLLGGVFTDKATWRWCFYINLPIGTITLGVILLLLKHPRQESFSHLPWKERFARLDIPGNLLLMLAIICLLLAIQWGGTKYHWQNARIIVLLVLALVLGTVFLVLQILLQEKATVPPRIFRIRSVWATCLFTFFIAGSMFYAMYYLPIWFQAVQGVSAVESGIRNLPLILSMTVATFVSGALASALGLYVPWMIGGAVVMTIGQGLLSTFTPDASIGIWIGYQCLAGLGIGSGMQQGMIAVQNVLSKSDYPTGISLVIFAQTLGGAMGVTIGQSIFNSQLTINISKFAPNVSPAMVILLGASHIQDGVPVESISGVRLAYNNAIATAFNVGIAFAGLSTIAACAVEWKSVKKPKPGQNGTLEAGEAHHNIGDHSPDMIKEYTAEHQFINNNNDETQTSTVGPQNFGVKKYEELISDHVVGPVANEESFGHDRSFQPDISIHNIYQSPEDMLRGEFHGALRTLSRSKGRLDVTKE